MQHDTLSLIGNTPLVRVQKIDTGPCELFVKLENQNPGGSIKDRIGLSMIEQAERDGKLGPGKIVVEATAGNTGLGLALVAARKGYRLILVVPDKMSREKILHLRALGADVVITRADVGKGHPEYYQDLAQAITARTPGAFYVNQFENPANPLAHERTTGPEIWRQMEQRLDAVVCGVGSGGTLTGLSRYFARVAPELELVLADPVGSILADYVRSRRVGQAGSWLVEGIGEDFVPSICDLSRVRAAYSISDLESFETARQLLRDEGLLAGSSSGTLVAAALRYCREQTRPRRVVTFICDSGNKYLSKMFNDDWMADQGFRARAGSGDLLDLVSRPHAEHRVVTVGPADQLTRAFALLRLYDVSQLPVVEDERLLGIIDESDLLLAVAEDERRFKDEVRAHMTTKLRTISRTASMAELLDVFAANLVPIVMEGDRFLGLITRVDLLGHLRRRVPAG
jgi:cystathionine beta-synthase